MTYGTSYFASKKAAIRYYWPLHGDDSARVVERKLTEGLITIGRPTVRPRETLSLIDGGTRYAITTTQGRNRAK